MRSGELSEGGGPTRPVLVRNRNFSPRSPEGQAWQLRLQLAKARLGTVPPPGVLALLHSSAAGEQIAEIYAGFRGASLACVLARMPQGHAGLPLKVGVQCAARLAHVYAAVERIGGVVHPGPTPEEVLLDARGELRVAGWIADGVAAPPLDEAHPLHYLWAGVDGYVPKEGPSGRQAGVRAAGALLIELMSGMRPPGAQADRGKLRRLIVRAFARPGVVIPDDVIAVVYECFYGAESKGTGAMAARLDSLAESLDGPGLEQWAPQVVPAVLAGKEIEAAAVDPISPLDRTSFTVHTGTGLPLPKTEGDEEAATVVLHERTGTAPAPVRPLPNPKIPDNVSPMPTMSVERMELGPREIPKREVGPRELVSREAVSPGEISVLAENPGPHPETRPPPGNPRLLAVALVIALLAIVGLLAERWLGGKTETSAPAPVPLSEPTAPVRPADTLPGPAVPTEPIPPSAPPPAVVPPPVAAERPAAPSPAPVAPTPGRPTTSAPPPHSPDEPVRIEPAPVPVDVQPTQPASAEAQPSASTFRVVFRSPDPAVERVKVTCQDAEGEGTREVVLENIGPGPCRVEARRGNYTMMARAAVSGPRTFECFAEGSRTCR